MFYDDLIKDKVVLVGFMSIAHDASYPVTRNLSQVQRLLGGRLGRDAHLYSITVDPAHDTVPALNAFARRHGAGPGWLFLTGGEEAMNAIRGAFFAHRGGHAEHGAQHPNGGEIHDCSMGLIRYGNDAVGLWGSVAALADPAQVVERLSWIEARPPRASGMPVLRGGPRPLHWLTNPSSQTSSRN
jgi:protein SCO1/2